MISPPRVLARRCPRLDLPTAVGPVIIITLTFSIAHRIHRSSSEKQFGDLRHFTRNDRGLQTHSIGVIFRFKPPLDFVQRQQEPQGPAVRAVRGLFGSIQFAQQAPHLRFRQGLTGFNGPVAGQGLQKPFGLIGVIGVFPRRTLRLQKISCTASAAWAGDNSWGMAVIRYEGPWPGAQSKPKARRPVSSSRTVSGSVGASSSTRGVNKSWEAIPPRRRP